MGAKAVGNAWAEDRMSLILCREKHKKLVRFYDVRDAGLANIKPPPPEFDPDSATEEGFDPGPAIDLNIFNW
jgi:hypothetical protein